jgi:hypothetical protein
VHEACGKCPISISCHQGRLKDVLLCPRCGIFQVTHVQTREVTDPNTGQTVKTGDTVTFRIDCPVREVEEDAYYDWCQESDRCGDRALDDNDVDGNSEHVWDEIAAMQASILIPDPGPPQAQYTNNTGGAIPVKLCNQCYGNEHVERID